MRVGIFFPFVEKRATSPARFPAAKWLPSGLVAIQVMGPVIPLRCVTLGERFVESKFARERDWAWRRTALWELPRNANSSIGAMASGQLRSSFQAGPGVPVGSTKTFLPLAKATALPLDCTVMAVKSRPIRTISLLFFQSQW